MRSIKIKDYRLQGWKRVCVGLMVGLKPSLDAGMGRQTHNRKFSGKRKERLREGPELSHNQCFFPFLQWKKEVSVYGCPQLDCFSCPSLQWLSCLPTVFDCFQHRFRLTQLYITIGKKRHHNLHFMPTLICTLFVENTLRLWSLSIVNVFSFNYYFLCSHVSNFPLSILREWFLKSYFLSLTIVKQF